MAYHFLRRLPSSSTPLTIMMAAAMMSWGCGDIETTPVDDPQEMLEQEDLTGLELAAQGLGEDPYAIGSDWYDYDPSTHVVTPEDKVWAITRGEGLLSLVEILSYYDERGESGIFTLRERAWGEQGWQAPIEVTLTRNLKEGQVCIGLVPMRELDCADSEAVLVARTSLRALPGAGFAVSNPALFTRAHVLDAPEDRVGVITLQAEDVNAVNDDAEAILEQGRVDSACFSPAASRVGWLHDRAESPARQDIHLQVTADLSLIQWQVTDIVREGDEIAVSVSMLCQKANVFDQQAFDPSSGGDRQLRLDASSDYSVTLVKFCDAEMMSPTMATTGAQTTPYRQDYPYDASSDMVVEQIKGRVSMRPAMGNLVWNWTISEGEGSTEWTPIDVSALWEE